MTPTLIMLLLAVLAVGGIVWFIRRKPEVRAPGERLEQDTAWNDPVTPDKPAEKPTPTEPRP